MVLGKSMESRFPINAIVISDDIEGVKMDGIDLHTFGNNQVSQVAALKQIDITKYHIKRIKEIKDKCQTKTDPKDSAYCKTCKRRGLL